MTNNHSESSMKSLGIILLAVTLSGINKVTGEVDCKKDCACCASTPDGSRAVGDICPRLFSECTYGCLDSYYGWRCHNKCPEYCTRCARYFGAQDNRDYQVCYLCADGYYNGTGVTDCSTACPVNCINNRCDKNSGRCLDGCIDVKWTGDKCDSCANGYYGADCLLPCPVYCKEDICDRGNGSCTYGCTDPRFIGTMCDKCQTGKYGEYCDKTCPDNCLDGECDRTEGACTNGCTGNFAGSQCERCNPGFYDENCGTRCLKCLNGQCDRSTGICDDCVGGYYGQYCNMKCSSRCNNDVCHQYNATCTFGCRVGYSGDKCCVRSNNCELCDTVKACSKCKSGFYGHSCGQTCPGKCAGGCGQTVGDCTVCMTGYYGNKCTEVCPYKCLDSECSQQSGKCTACNIGYYGDACNNTCPDSCVKKFCYQDDGKCGDCMTGFHGAWCDLECATYCVNDTCIQETGTCMYGCVEDDADKCAQNNFFVHDIVGTIIGGIVGGFSVVIIILVGYIIHLRCRLRETKETKDPEPNNGVELEEQHDYEGLDGELRNETTVYSDLQSDGDYVNDR